MYMSQEQIAVEHERQAALVALTPAAFAEYFDAEISGIVENYVAASRLVNSLPTTIRIAQRREAAGRDGSIIGALDFDSLLVSRLRAELYAALRAEGLEDASVALAKALAYR